MGSVFMGDSWLRFVETPALDAARLPFDRVGIRDTALVDAPARSPYYAHWFPLVRPENRR